MAVEKVELNAGDNHSHVAYQMAKDLWFNEYGSDPKMTDEKFYGLVYECWCCLSYRGPGKFIKDLAK
ncbi:MAG: hypothetical protein ACSHXW_02420 [Yoonia sp.]